MNFIDIGLSFIEGLALIASPCILPVLPLVLAASVEGGRSRPFGIITGFVLAFTAFALLSRRLVAAFHIDLDYIKFGSLVLLTLLGLILLSETLSQRFSSFTQRFATAGTNLTANTGSGFMSGVFIGLLIGLVWTPCAGPILAAVLVQVIRQESDLSGLFIIAAFALGAGVPMLIIALTGRKIMAKLGLFTTHAEAVRKSFGIILLLAVGFIASGADAQNLFSTKKDESTLPETSQAASATQSFTTYAVPEFTGIEAWLNSKPLTMASLKGKVVLIDFWTYSCINCVRTLPYITKWDQTYRDKGLVIIGVHAPEFEFEKNKSNVEAAIAEHGIQYPVALDNKLDTWTAFKNRYWPAHYLIDKEGKVVYTHFGEGNYVETENAIRTLLGLSAEAKTEPAAQISEGQTPETYLGVGRAETYQPHDIALKGGKAKFEFASELPLHKWTLDGEWNIEGEKITSVSAGATLRIHFKARKVFLVMGAQNMDKPPKISLTLNGKPLGENAGADSILSPDGLFIDRQTIYALVDQKTLKEGVLDIKSDLPNVDFYAFTFGE